MNAGLRRLIADYRRAVAEAVRLLEAAGVPRPASNMEWTVMDFPQSGWLPDGRRYMKHGFGCLVTGPQSSVDFDFGDRGEIDGIEPCFLADFAEGRLSEYGFESRDAVLTLFRRACTDGELRKSGGLGGLYFLSDAVDKS